MNFITVELGLRGPWGTDVEQFVAVLKPTVWCSCSSTFHRFLYIILCSSIILFYIPLRTSFYVILRSSMSVVLSYLYQGSEVLLSPGRVMTEKLYF